MKIIIAGVGKVGATIVEQLSAEGHELSIIDTDADVVKKITNTYDVIGVVGNAASHQVQKDAGVEEADLLIAVTDSDEGNLLCCLIAKKEGCRTIARVRNPIYNQEIGFIKEELGLSMYINPEQAAAAEISRILRFPAAINIETFARGRIELMEFIVAEDNVLEGKRVMDVRKTTHADILIAAIERGDEVFIPQGDFVINQGDRITIVASPLESREFFKAVGMETQKVKYVMIVGGGTICYYLTRQLTALGMDVKIIEKDRNRCEQLAELVPKATIINGDATDENIILEEGLESCDAFVALTGIDEANIFFSMFAREKAPEAKTVTKVNKMNYEEIISSLDIGSIVYPKNMTAERIVRFVRALQNGMGSNVEALHRIIKNKVEALEFLVREGSELVGKPLMNLELLDNLLVVAIMRGRDVIYPKGSDTIEVGDRVIVVTTNKGLNDLKDILK